MPGDSALIRGDSVHTRAVAPVRAFGLRATLGERSPMLEGGDRGGCARGASGDPPPTAPPSEEHTDPTDPAGDPGDSDIIDMAVSVGDPPNALLSSPMLGSATAISMGLAPASTDVAIIACATPCAASLPPS